MGVLMRLMVLSDLHLEFAPWWPDEDALKFCDAVILAGDVSVGPSGVEWAAETFAGKPVIYVLGNHEFYGGNISRTAIEIARAAEGSNVLVLDNSEFVMKDVRFLGCTLWTNFKFFGDKMSTVGDALNKAQRQISDFSHITFGTTGRMRPAQSVILHEASVRWLAERLSEPFDGKTVVVSHHVPSETGVEQKYRMDILTAAFASRLDYLVEKADLWVFGHTHSPCDAFVGGCRLLANPRGYPSEESGWRPNLIVEI